VSEAIIYRALASFIINGRPGGNVSSGA